VSASKRESTAHAENHKAKALKKKFGAYSFSPLIMLPMPEKVFVRAADFYRKLRKQGITIRKSNDCIIAAAALEHHCQLPHNDKDFSPIAEHFPLKIIST
jgi:predicted nucleic acid-binding protein